MAVNPPYKVPCLSLVFLEITIQLSCVSNLHIGSGKADLHHSPNSIPIMVSSALKFHEDRVLVLIQLKVNVSFK